MGSKGGSNQTTTSTTSGSSSPPPQVLAEYQGLVDRATNVANQPYQPYQGELVAPLSSQTLQGLGGMNQYAYAAQPYLGAAGGMTLAGSGAVNPEQFQGMGSLAPYMNPYTQSVVQATQNELANQNAQQAQFLNSANISSGAFGGDRAGIGQAILANQQQLAEAPTIAGLNQANYNQAMANWQNQQQVNLAAQQANQARLLSGAGQLGQIGLSAQQAGTTGAQAQIEAGMIPQQEQQAIDQAAQQMYQQQQAYPFTTTGWLGNIVEGTGSLSGGTTQSTGTTTSPGPNQLGQYLGAGFQGLGLLSSFGMLSDVRAKENVEPVGETYDGKRIYRYNFKGDPRTQIGLLAQEEAYREPGNVQRIGMGDLLGIDYEGATDEAAERGHFQYGGMPSSTMQSVGRASGLGALGSLGSGSTSPGMDLMLMGAGGARTSFGAPSLMSGADIHPDVGFDAGQDFGGTASQQRQGFQTGGDVNPIMSEVANTWSPGQSLGTSGVSTALFDAATAGTPWAQYGIDESQINAIAGGQWMPPVTTQGQQLPDWQHLQNTPQFGSAEQSLKGLFGPGYTPGQAYGATNQPAQTSTPTTQQSSGTGAFDTGGFGQAVADMYTQAQNVSPAAKLAGVANALPGGANPTNSAIALQLLQNSAGLAASGTGTAASSGTGASGGKAMGGRIGYQGGGAPTLNDPRYSYYTPTTGIGRGGGTYYPPAAPVQQAPPAIAIQRQLQGQARARAAVAHGLTRPTHIVHTVAPDPVTGQPHHLHPPVVLPHRPVTPTPQPLHDRPPLPSDPRDPQSIWPYGPPVRAGAGPRTAGVEPPGGPEPSPGDPLRLPGATEPSPVGADETLPAGYSGGTQVAPRTAPITGEIIEPQTVGGAMRKLRPPGLLGQLPSPSEATVTSRLNAPPTLGDVWSGITGRGQPPVTFQKGEPLPSSGDIDRMLSEGGRDFEGPGQGYWGQGDEHPLYATGGRVGFQDGGAANDDPLSGLNLDAGDDAFVGDLLSGAQNVEDSGEGFAGDLLSGRESVQGGAVDPSTYAPTDITGYRVAGVNAPLRGPPGGMDPRATALAPGSGGGGGFGSQIHDLGERIGHGLDNLFGVGHYTPTTGVGRGGGTWVPPTGGAGGAVDPRARAQAPPVHPAAVHPAIAIRRHIAQTRTPTRPRTAPGPAPGIVDPEIDARWKLANPNPPDEDPEILARWKQLNPVSHTPGGASWAQLPASGTSGSWERGGRVGRQGGGGLMGSSPVQNTGGYTPQGFGMSGQTSQGQGLGAFATSKAASGFGDLFGRQGFQSGGQADPLIAMIEGSAPGARGGQGPPSQAPEPPKPPSQSGSQQGSPEDIMKQAGAALKQFKGGQGGQSQTGVQTSPTGSSGSDVYNYAADPQLQQPQISDQMNADATLGADIGSAFDLSFATGGGVGLGSLRRPFQDGGAPDAVGGQTDDAMVSAEPAPAPTRGGGGGGGGGGGIYGGLLQRGWNPAQAAALAGNMQQESNFNPGAWNSGEGAGGLIQWRGDRLAGLQAYAAKRGTDWRDTGTQLDYIGYEMNGPEARSSAAFKSADNVADANAALRSYIRYGDKSEPTRLANAEKIAGGGGTLPTGDRTGYFRQTDTPSPGAQPDSSTMEGYGGGFKLPASDYPQQREMPTMGSELRRDPGGYLMTVGAAMMSSRSPWFGTMLGEGFAAGNKYLQSQEQLENEWNLNQAHINQLGASARESDAKVALTANQLQIAQLGMKIKLQALREAGFNIDGSGASAGTGTGGQGGGLAPVAPLGPLGTGAGAGAGAGAAAAAPGPAATPSGAGAGAAPGASVAPSGGAGAGAAPATTTGTQAPSDFQTSYQALAKEYKRLQGLEIAGIVQPGAAALVRQQMIEAQKTGRIVTPDGRTVLDPSFVSQEAGAEQKKRAAGTYGEEASKEMNSEEMEYADKQAPLQEQLQRLDDASTILKAFQPGAGAETIAEAQNIARRFGFDIGDPSAVMEFLKLSREASFDVVRTMKGQVRNMELQSAGQQVFSPNLSDQANRYLIDRLRGAVKQQLDYLDAFGNWRSGEGKEALSPNAFRGKWYKEHPYKSYIDEGLTTPKAAAPGPTQRPQGIPSSAVPATSSHGRKGWYDPKTKKAWDADGNAL